MYLIMLVSHMEFVAATDFSIYKLITSLYFNHDHSHSSNWCNLAYYQTLMNRHFRLVFKLKSNCLEKLSFILFK